jgi:hypothetical protein
MGSKLTLTRDVFPMNVGRLLQPSSPILTKLYLFRIQCISLQWAQQRIMLYLMTDRAILGDTQNQSYLRTDGQSASLSWHQAAI